MQLTKTQRDRAITKLVQDEQEYVRNIALQNPTEFYAYIEKRILVSLGDHRMETFDDKLLHYYQGQFAVDIDTSDDIQEELGE